MFQVPSSFVQNHFYYSLYIAVLEQQIYPQSSEIAENLSRHVISCLYLLPDP